MDRAPISVFNSTTTACVDCAHFMADTRECARAPMVDKITGKDTFKDAGSERIWNCGEKAIHFMPSASADAARSVRKLHLQRSIEDSIGKLNPDLNQALEILDALTASIERRFDGRIEDVLDEAKAFRAALSEADETVPQ